MDVGVIGLGTMGARMVDALLGAGHRVFVHDISETAMDRVVASGARAARSSAEVGGGAVRVVLLSLPRPEHVADVVAGEAGLLSGAADGLTIVDTSTVDPGTSRKLSREAQTVGAGYLDAPILGRPDACGNWVLPVGGDADALDAATPVLGVLASTVKHAGESGAGNAIKLLNNLMFGAINAITVEVFAAAPLVGVSPQIFYETVTGSDAATVSKLFREVGRKILEEDFSSTFTLELLHKDNALAMQMIRDVGGEAVVGSAVETLNGLARARGRGTEDTSAAIKLYEEVFGERGVSTEPENQTRGHSGNDGS